MIVKFMPDTYKPVWGKMNENEKGRIFAKSQLYNLNTPYQVKSFWDEQDLRGVNERVAIETQNIKEMQKLNEGETSGIIKSEFGYHILKLDEIIPSKLIPFAKTKTDIMNLLLKLETQKLFTTYVEDLGNQAKIEVLL